MISGHPIGGNKQNSASKKWSKKLRAALKRDLRNEE
jgi:hypothetical protein